MNSFENFSANEPQEETILPAIILDTPEFQRAKNEEALNDRYATEQGSEINPEEMMEEISKAIRFCLADGLTNDDAEVQKHRGQLRYWYEKVNDAN